MFNYRALADTKQQNILDKLAIIRADAEMAEHQWWIETWPAETMELRNFILAIQKELPQIKVFPSKTKRNRVYSFLLYMEGDDYAMGYVEYAPMGRQHQYQYIVGSPNVYNGRKSGEAIYCTGSKNLATAIKNVKKYVRPLSCGELVKVTYQKIADYISGKQMNVYRQMRDTKDAVLKDLSGLICELDREGKLVSEGYKNTVHALAEALRLEQAIENSKPVFDFVQLKGDRAVIREVVSNGTMYKSGHPEYSCGVEELSRSIAEGVAVLSIMDIGTVIEGVGVRATNSIFYVERKDASK